MSKLERKFEDNEAAPDELGDDPGQVGSSSAGQSGDTQGLDDIEESAGESLDELVETEQDYEAEILEGVEDAGNHPERPVHTHLEYGHPDDFPRKSGSR